MKKKIDVYDESNANKNIEMMIILLSISDDIVVVVVVVTPIQLSILLFHLL